MQDVVDLVADQIMPAFGAQGLVLSTAEAGRLRITGHRGYPAETIRRLDGLPLDTTFTPAGQALGSGIPAFFANPEEMRRTYPEAPVVSGKKAWAFLPLIISSRPVGVCILSYDSPHEFPAEERAVLTSLAGLIAQAFDRARLYDVKHDLAHGLQQALLPRGLPTLDPLRVAARYLPATRGMEIGGDFYDLIRLGADAAAAVIGDVQGHNVAAAALMGQVRTAVHAHATLGTPPTRSCTGPTGCSPTSPPTCSPAASTSTSTSPANAYPSPAQAIRRRCCASPTATPGPSSSRPDLSWVSTPTPSSRSSRSR